MIGLMVWCGNDSRIELIVGMVLMVGLRIWAAIQYVKLADLLLIQWGIGSYCSM